MKTQPTKTTERNRASMLILIAMFRDGSREQCGAMFSKLEDAKAYAFSIIDAGKRLVPRQSVERVTVIAINRKNKGTILARYDASDALAAN